ncbi:juvenile hormone esterase-like [Ceratina calcarata]|uniref:Juvenile hormone esterase-like n=1 Tax=Ceratina calcarata TaxID=156304 RepID=A0AAJ7NBF8_9HYME|nr:juvenile hormone esterase-like [Ceratina calcarata]
MIMFQTDAIFMWPAYRTAQAFSKVINSSIYFYLFSYHGTFSNTLKLTPVHHGVAHVDDLNYLIPLLNKKFESHMLHNTENDITMINIMTEMWASFATTGYVTIFPNHQMIR